MELKTRDVERKLTKKEKEEFMERVYKVNSGEYKTEWTALGKIGIQKERVRIKRGGKARAAGGQFELRVRKDLEAKGWIVDKWSNNVDLEGGE
ncbi:MAG: hypothetical protein KKF50_02925 [Nanoarchaeota archaeon]|nr:hypothetical protein [Nanoarchaeota archaeon]